MQACDGFCSWAQPYGFVFFTWHCLCVCVYITIAYLKKRGVGGSKPRTPKTKPLNFSEARETFVKHSRRLAGQSDSLASLLVCSSWLGEAAKILCLWAVALSSWCCKRQKVQERSLNLFLVCFLYSRWHAGLKWSPGTFLALNLGGLCRHDRVVCLLERVRGCISVPVGISQRVIHPMHLCTPHSHVEHLLHSHWLRRVFVSNAVEFVFLGVFFYIE